MQTLKNRFTPQHFKLLLKLRDSEDRAPQEFDLDDVMILGGHRLIEFSDKGGLNITERGRRLLRRADRE